MLARMLHARTTHLERGGLPGLPLPGLPLPGLPLPGLPLPSYMPTIYKTASRIIMVQGKGRTAALEAPGHTSLWVQQEGTVPCPSSSLQAAAASRRGVPVASGQRQVQHSGVQEVEAAQGQWTLTAPEVACAAPSSPEQLHSRWTGVRRGSRQ